MDEQYRNGGHRKTADTDVAGYIHNSKSHYGSGVGPQGIEVCVAFPCVVRVIEPVFLFRGNKGRRGGCPGGIPGEGMTIRITPRFLFDFAVDDFALRSFNPGNFCVRSLGCPDGDGQVAVFYFLPLNVHLAACPVNGAIIHHHTIASAPHISQVGGVPSATGKEQERANK